MSSPYTVRHHSRARRLKLRVLRDGSVQVTAPRHACPARIRAFVDDAQSWIQRRRAALADQRLPAAERGPLPALVRLRAIDTRLSVSYAEAAVSCWRLERDTLMVEGSDLAPAATRGVLIDALTTLAQRFLGPRLRAWAGHAGLQPSRVTWRNQKSRWGSCSAGGAISLNIRLLFLEPVLVDYVLVHELVHLEHPDHSPAFHARVEALLPGSTASKSALRHAGARVPDWIL